MSSSSPASPTAPTQPDDDSSLPLPDRDQLLALPGTSRPALTAEPRALVADLGAGERPLEQRLTEVRQLAVGVLPVELDMSARMTSSARFGA